MATVTGTTTDPLASYRAASNSAAKAADADRFLTLLVTQMKNQDPLNPLDNAQVTSQLAQINTVKGIEQMNGTLADLGLRFDAMQVLQAASVVDRNVLVGGTDMTVTDKGGAGAFELGAAADSVQIRVLDGAGNAVHVTTMADKGVGMHDFKWDGKLANGKPAAPGTYKLEITATADGKPVTPTTYVASTVTSLTRGANGFALALANGQMVGMADLKRLY
ncbi:MAG: flagellar hook assembly protein FlgD [Burkholderiales bacterium]|nr:flagellar hook assembly protein FlgD [Burkholderiales bacterium]